MTWMTQMHPMRKINSGQVLELGRAQSASRHDDDVGAAIASVSAIGDAIDRLHIKIEEQEKLIVELQLEVRELTIHKEAAYSEMTKAENALRSERDRAERSEQLFKQTVKNERELQEKVSRLITSVRDTFNRTERSEAA